MELKDKIKSFQSIVGIIAIFVGGWWTYDNFIQERKHVPHANIEHRVSHIPLTPDTNLLLVAVVIANTGHASMEIRMSDIRLQQVLPLSCVKGYSKCAKREISEALKNVSRADDIFSWPMIAQRKEERAESDDVEPGEKEQLDFEFVVPKEVTAVRIYSYIRNERKVGPDSELGWRMASYYEFSKPAKEKL